MKSMQWAYPLLTRQGKLKIFGENERQLPFFPKKSSTRGKACGGAYHPNVPYTVFVVADMPDDHPGKLIRPQEVLSAHCISDDRAAARRQGFYPKPANPIPCQIQQKDFPIKPLVSGKQDQKDQKNQIPQGFIEKRGMYLDIRDTIYFHDVPQQAVRHILQDMGQQKSDPNGKQPVRITAKCLPVKKISPPAI